MKRRIPAELHVRPLWAVAINRMVRGQFIVAGSAVVAMPGSFHLRVLSAKLPCCLLPAALSLASVSERYRPLASLVGGGVKKLSLHVSISRGRTLRSTSFASLSGRCAIGPRSAGHLHVMHHYAAHCSALVFASNTARANPIGVALRKFARSSLGGIRCILLPSVGSTRAFGGIVNPLPVQRHVFLV